MIIIKKGTSCVGVRTTNLEGSTCSPVKGSGKCTKYIIIYKVPDSHAKKSGVTKDLRGKVTLKPSFEH